MILSLLCVVLAVAFVSRHRGAGRTTDALLAQSQTLSNQLTELRQTLVTQQTASSVTLSNVQDILSHRTSNLQQTSNRLVQANLRLLDAQNEAREAQRELQSKAARIALLEVQGVELERKDAHIAGLEEALQQSAKQLGTTEAARAATQHQWEVVALEKAELEHKLTDVAFLQRQLSRAQEQAGLRKRMAAAKPGSPPDDQALLEILPNGTVRVVPPPPP